MYEKVFALLLALTLALSLAACGGKPNDAPPASGGDGAEDSGEQVRVACILSGPISDMSWNYTAHQGMLRIEQMGAEIAYQENVENSALPDCINTYATDGYDVIILSTNSYEESAMPITKDFLTPSLLSSTARPPRATSPATPWPTRIRALCRGYLRTAERVRKSRLCGFRGNHPDSEWTGRL